MTNPIDSSDEIVVSSDGPVRIITINRPDQMNAANAALHRGLTQVWSGIAADPDAAAVVITGAGEAFCAGGDLSWIVTFQEDQQARALNIAEARHLVEEMVRFPLPVVAAVNGPAIGLGCSVALLSDIVFMADTATLADPHVAIGLVAGDGGPVIWPLLTSLLRTKEFLFTGDAIGAADAERLGLANRVVPAASVLPDAIAYAHRLAGLPQFALRATKRALNLHVERAMSGILDFAVAAESESFTTDDHKERVRRFLDRSAKRTSDESSREAS